MILTRSFFNRDAQNLARALLGKVLRVKHQEMWLSAMIIETEAYYIGDKASHSSLGYTPRKKALFMTPGTIYMYYSRAGDSLNVRSRGQGNAVLMKSAVPYVCDPGAQKMIREMQQLNPTRNGQVRSIENLCRGQTLLCKALDLKIKAWDQKQFQRDSFYIDDIGYGPLYIIQTQRLGIPPGRDEERPYRFIDERFVDFCTKKPKCF